MSEGQRVSLVSFLQQWMNGPIPHYIVDAGAEIMALDEYTPEKRAHQIVTKCVQLWMEHDHGQNSHAPRPKPISAASPSANAASPNSSRSEGQENITSPAA